MRCDTDSYITWPYQIADHNCRITWVYNKMFSINKRNTTRTFTIRNCGRPLAIPKTRDRRLTNQGVALVTSKVTRRPVKVWIRGRTRDKA